eukprot:Em0017g165a
MFGTFRCKGCNNTWYSGNAWNGYGQQCKSCLGTVMPELRPLQGGPRHQEGPPHVQSLCDRCKKLGYNCRVDNDVKDSEDVESVASEDRGSSAGNSDEDHTPKGSDDDDDDGTGKALEKLVRLSLK